MRARLFNINAYYKYKKEIDKKNIAGLTWNTSTFLGVIALDFIMKLILNPTAINPVMIIYVAAALIVLSVWLKFRRFQDWCIIMNYIIGFTFVSHMQMIYQNHTILPFFFLVAVSNACALIMNPFYLILGQAQGAIAFFICYCVSMDGKPDSIGVITVIATFIVAVLAGLLFWFIRMETLVFNNELNYITTGSDDLFAGNNDKAFWEGKDRYGFTDVPDSAKRKTFTIIFNHTKNKLVSVRDNNVFDLRPAMDWDEIKIRMQRYAADPKTYRALEEFFDPKEFKDEFRNENFKRSLNGVFNIRGGDRMWLDFEMSLRPHPVSGEIMNVLLIEDITEDRVFMGVLNKLISQDYDMVVCMERGKHNTLVFHSIEGEEVKGESANDYESEMIHYVTAHVADYDRERALKSAHLKNVYEELKSKDLYAFTVDESRSEGEPRKKYFAFSYLDPGKRFLVILKKDVTDVVRKNNETREMLELALKNATEANNAKIEFLTKLSREMKIPVNAILSVTDSIEKELDKPAYIKEELARIRKTAGYLNGMLDDARDMSGLDLKHVPIKIESVRFGDIINDIEAVIAPLCKAKNVYFALRSEIADKFTIKADKTLLERAFNNLLENATVSTDAGGEVVFNCYITGEEDKRADIRFVIKDNGPGISEEEIEDLFAPFSRETVNLEGKEGTGMKLTVAKLIINEFGGVVTATGKIGVGITIVADMSFETDNPVKPKADKEIRIEEISGRRILLADDNEINRTDIGKLLADHDILYDCAVNGAEAVEKFSGSEINYYDAILMDIHMPKMNGLEASRYIRALTRPDAEDIPIIALSSNNYPGEETGIAYSGMNTSLAKPVSKHVLYETLAREIEIAKV